MVKDNLSWFAYLSKMRGATIAEENLQTKQFQKLFHSKSSFSNEFDNCIPAYYLMDYTSGKFRLMSNSLSSILCCRCHEHTEHDLNFIIEHYDSKHLQLFNEEIFPDRLNFLKTIPPNEHKNYVFSYSFRFRSDCGKTFSLLHRNRYTLSDIHHHPLVSFGVLSKIEHFKTIAPIIQTIEKIVEDDSTQENTLVFKKTYYLEKETCLFTKRESELLTFLAEGLSSKEIADRLFVSEYTIINHRRNMILKSHCHNVAQLISYASRKGLINMSPN